MSIIYTNLTKRMNLASFQNAIPYDEPSILVLNLQYEHPFL